MSTILSVVKTPLSPFVIPNLLGSVQLEVVNICHAFHTLLLFTYTDLKTIMLPVTVFACVAGPVHCPWALLQGITWIWLHLLQCNVSNQYKSISEDLINHPWRPLPSGRISTDRARWLRWLLVPICLSASAYHGIDVVLVSATLTLTTVLYDEVGLAGHCIGKSLCAVPGYLTFEIGATRILASRSLDNVARMSLLYSALVIATTIHVQDFPDVDGDRVRGRVTIPIWSPKGSRVFTLLAILAWTLVLCQVWEIGAVHSLILGATGAGLGCRIYCWRDRAADNKSYVMYNAWLLTMHALPAQVRWGTGHS